MWFDDDPDGVVELVHVKVDEDADMVESNTSCPVVGVACYRVGCSRVGQNGVDSGAFFHAFINRRLAEGSLQHAGVRCPVDAEVIRKPRSYHFFYRNALVRVNVGVRTEIVGDMLVVELGHAKLGPVMQFFVDHADVIVTGCSRVAV